MTPGSSVYDNAGFMKSDASARKEDIKQVAANTTHRIPFSGQNTAKGGVR